MLKKVLIVVVAAIAAVLIYASTRPDSFRVERAAAIAAPAETIFPFINDFSLWSKWTPFDALDPNMKKTLSGAPSGVGAVSEWEGNMKAGAGRMEIVESNPPSEVVIKLEFKKPMKAVNEARFTLTPGDGATQVAWSLEGPMPLMSKVMSLFMDMDKMVGGDFERGLASLKAQSEQAAAEAAKAKAAEEAAKAQASKSKKGRK